jgi:hypothetical protein
MTIRTLLPVFAAFFLLADCKKSAPSLTLVRAEIITFSAHEGHIFNIFALDRVHTHSFNAVEGIQDHPWSLQISNVDIMGETGQLFVEPNVGSSIIIENSTMSSFDFTNSETNQHKTVAFQQGAKFSIDFDNAQEATDLMNKSPQEQRDTLMALARGAMSESFNVSTH